MYADATAPTRRPSPHQLTPSFTCEDIDGASCHEERRGSNACAIHIAVLGNGHAVDTGSVNCEAWRDTELLQDISAYDGSRWRTIAERRRQADDASSIFCEGAAWAT